MEETTRDRIEYKEEFALFYQEKESETRQPASQLRVELNNLLVSSE